MGFSTARVLRALRNTHLDKPRQISQNYLRIILARYTASIMSFDLMAKDLSSSSTLRLGSKLKTSCTSCRPQHVRAHHNCTQQVIHIALSLETSQKPMLCTRNWPGHLRSFRPGVPQSPPQVLQTWSATKSTSGPSDLECHTVHLKCFHQ